MKKDILVFGLVLLVGSVFAAASGVSNVKDAMSGLLTGLQGILPVAAMLMVLVAGVIYASGQMMGAETRARANVWATAALTGALVSVLIVIIAPSVLTVMYGSDISGNAGGQAADPCAGITCFVACNNGVCVPGGTDDPCDDVNPCDPGLSCINDICTPTP